MLKKKHKEKNIYKHERGLHYKPLSKILLISVIAILCVISYLPAYKNNITNWDDDRYISKNPYITSLSFFNVKEIFSNFYFCNYHPLTMLSLALDYSIGGTSPFVFHFTNVLLHIINSLLVFWLVLLVLNDLKTAFFCGLLFGVHTLHVESVAWIAERKDVLYSLFYLLSFISYIKYIKLTRKDALPKISACAIAVTPNEVSLRVRVNYYLLSLVLFIMSVLSKGMAVTLPLVLIATDYFYNRKLLSKKIIAEKIPFLIISLIFGIIAILAQKTETAISGLESYRLDESIVFACYALFQYVLKLLLPAGLSSFYPYPSEISWFFWFYPLIIMLIIAIIVFSLKYSREYLFGFIFFCINLIFVLQIIPVGKAIIADRYSYLSSVGLFLILGSFSKQYSLKPTLKITIPLVLLVYSIYLSALTYERCKIWKDSITLWSDVILKYPDLYLGYSNRGIAKADVGGYKGAILDYNKAIELKDDFDAAYFNRGTAKMYFKDFKGAVIDFDKVISLNPPRVCEAYNNRGVAKSELNEYEAAIADFAKAVELDSLYANAYCNGGNALYFLGKYQESALDFKKALQIEPENALIYYKRGNTLYLSKDYRNAMKDINKAIAINPDYFEAFMLRGNIRTDINDLKNAIADFTKAIEIMPNSVEAYFNRGNTLLKLQEFGKAIADFTKVINYSPPRVAEAYYTRGIAEIYSGKLKEACMDFSIALQDGYAPAQKIIEKYCMASSLRSE